MVKDFVKRFKWKGPVFEISALTREGCEPLIKAIYQHVHDQQQAEHAWWRSIPASWTMHPSDFAHCLIASGAFWVRVRGQKDQK